ncbi:MAG: CopG family transcriptional regulator [Chlorobium sp.]|nr:MAG: CopG family transcriptional regulator [Chlorobium sp.]
MGKTKIAITVDAAPLIKIDQQVRNHIFLNRTQAIQDALYEKIGRIERSRLAEEFAKLDPIEECKPAEDGFAGEIETWPEY